ncbi:hypothetical protein E3P99_03911 [Wallemia hederae]|uniref:Serine hydrolase domain-containing protein n=1 Tax=Wallemia hederae TaxID=1540922 RepID=A0A4T0FCM6_9BASI|nr:hypothetical protein E3P99_03911 [Wallemia hederae]
MSLEEQGTYVFRTKGNKSSEIFQGTSLTAGKERGPKFFLDVSTFTSSVMLLAMPSGAVLATGEKAGMTYNRCDIRVGNHAVLLQRNNLGSTQRHFTLPCGLKLEVEANTVLASFHPTSFSYRKRGVMRLLAPGYSQADLLALLMVIAMHLKIHVLPFCYSIHFTSSEKTIAINEEMPKLQVLVLHGYTQSASIFARKMSKLTRDLSDTCDLHFIDGPIRLDKIAMPNAEQCGSSDDSSIPRGWCVLRTNRHTGKLDFEHIDLSWSYIKDVLSINTYDGIFAFSQGAAFAAALAGVLANTQSRSDIRNVHPPFKFCITLGGYKVVDARYKHIYPLPPSGLPTHFLHIHGDTDMIVLREKNDALVKSSPGCRTERHLGGHFVPSTPAWRDFFVRYISSFVEGGEQGNVVGPQIYRNVP